MGFSQFPRKKEAKMSAGNPSSAAIREELLDITNCCVCTDTFTDPRTLPCLHTFCKKCLEDIITKSDKGNGETLPCPMCRREFVIPVNGVSGLEKNFFMVRLVEMSRSSSVQTKSLCDSCTEDSEISEVPMAEMFCQECCLKLCESCCKHHRKLKLTMDHRLVPVHEQTEALLKMKTEFCEQHEKERLRIYCSDCAICVCAFCFLESHQNHKWKDAQTAAKEFRQHIQTCLKQVSIKNSGLDAKRVELESAKAAVDENFQLVARTVIERRMLMKDLIEKHSDLLMAQLEDKRQEKLKEIALKDEAIESQISNGSNYLAYCEEITEKGSDVDVCRSQLDIKRRGKELQKMGKKMWEQKPPEFTIFLGATQFDDLMKQKDFNIIGSMQVGGDISQTSQSQTSESCEHLKLPPTKAAEKQSKSKPEKPRLSGADKKPSSGKKPASSPLKSGPSPQPFNATNPFAANFVRRDTPWHSSWIKPAVEIVLSKQNRITGIAIIEEELFLITEMNPHCEVYNLSTFAIKRTLKVQNLAKPEDMVASSELKCLFIFDASDDGKILQVDRHTGTVTHQCLTGSKNMRLSVTSENHVLATFLDKGRLKEYSFTSPPKLINTISLTSGGSTFAAKRTTGAYLVSRRESTDGKVPQGVFEVDSSGKPTSTFFTGQPDSHFGKMVDPDQLIVDRHEWVIVADRGTKRILLLNPQLQFERVLFSEYRGLSDPHRIVFDQSANRLGLLVADYDKEKKIGRIYSAKII